MKIVLDPGHGGTDPGAVGNGLRECDIALSLANRANEALVGRANVAVTRHKNDTVALTQRVLVSNGWPADRFVSIHCNSWITPQPSGVMTLVSRFADEAMRAWAEVFHRRIIQDCDGRVDRGVKTDWDVRGGDLIVLRDTDCPALLVEIGFLSNEHDAAWLSREDVRDRLGRAIADAAILG